MALAVWLLGECLVSSLSKVVSWVDVRLRMHPVHLSAVNIAAVYIY